jgi:hypothetical protein
MAERGNAETLAFLRRLDLQLLSGELDALGAKQLSGGLL